MSPDRFQEKLDRFDRRLRVRRNKRKPQFHQIVYKDAGGMSAVAVNELDLSQGDREIFKSMCLASPWKMNQSYGQWMSEIERRNDVMEDTSAESADAADEAWTMFNYYKNFDTRVHTWAERRYAEAAARRQKMEHLIDKGATDDEILDEVPC